MSKTTFAVVVSLILSSASHLTAQPIKLTIGQTGINPGTGPLLIA